MYLYALTGFEEMIVLSHDKKFSKNDFNTMCKEAPILDYGESKYYESVYITEYLIENYGFKKVEYEADFYINQEVTL